MADQDKNKGRSSDDENAKRCTIQQGQRLQPQHHQQIHQTQPSGRLLEDILPSELLALSQAEWKQCLQEHQGSVTQKQLDEFNKHYLSFVHHVDIRDVLDFMVQDGIICDEQQQEIFNEPSDQASMRKLLSFMRQGGQSAYRSLARAFRLSFPDQKGIRLELSRLSELPQMLPSALHQVFTHSQVPVAAPCIQHGEQAQTAPPSGPLVPEHKDFIQNNYVALVNSFDAADLLPNLMHQGVISDEQHQIILRQASKQNQMRKLLSLTLKKGVIGSTSLYQAISIQNQQERTDGLSDDQPEAATEYFTELQNFHKRKLHALAKEKPATFELTSYVQMSVYTKEQGLHNLRKGFRETILQNIKVLGKPIESGKLFSSFDDKPAPKKVLLMGSPGVGKTMTAYHFLSQNINSNLWSGDICFIIFIILRELNYLVGDISFQDLLFNIYGPPIKNEDQTLKYLIKNQGKLLFILDGFDEADGLGVNIRKECKITFQRLDKTTNPQQLIYNLIRGDIFPDAKVLITGRPHVLEQLQSLVDRQVELLGLDKDKLYEMAQRELSDHPDLARDVVEYFDAHPSVFTLCSVPVNAKGFLQFVKMNPQAEHIHECLPKTKAGLLFMVALNLLMQHDKLFVGKKDLLSSDILQERKQIICKLAKVAYEGLFGLKAMRQLFDSQDITKYGVSTDEVIGCGLMTGHLSAVADFFRQIQKVLLQFDHLTLQEFLGALELSQLPLKDLRAISQKQEGERDMILQLSLGAMGDPQYQDLLNILYPDTPTADYSHKTTGLLQTLWSSPRHYQENGILYSIHCISESRQLQLANTLAKQSVNAYNALNLTNTTISSADCFPLGDFLAKMSDPCYDVCLNGRLDVAGLQHVLQSGGSQGLTLITDVTPQTLAVITKAINTSKTITHLSLIHYESGAPLTNADWAEFQPAHTSMLKCLELDRVLNELTVVTVCDKLHSLHSLQVLRLVRTTLPDTTLLSAIPITIKYLTLFQCGLDGSDIPVITDIVLRNGLVWLNITYNNIGEIGASSLAKCMKDPHNMLQGLILYNCHIPGSGIQLLCESLVGKRHLKVLNLSYNEVGERADAVVGALSDSSIEEVYLAGCGISAEGGSLLLASLTHSSTLTCLSLYNNALNTTSAAHSLCDMLAANHHLLALGLGNCGMTDASLGIITEGLMHNDHLRLLDLNTNQSLTCSSIRKLLTNTKLQVLCVAGCELGREGWREVGQALSDNKHIKICQVGDGKGREEDMVGLMGKLIHKSMSAKLQHLVLKANKHRLSSLICQLEHTSTIKVSCSDKADTAWELSGLLYFSIPPNILHWYTGYYAFTY